MPTDSENRIQQHTPGPWQWSVAEDSPCADIRAGDTTVAYVLWGHGYFDGQRLPPIEQAEANAPLIAAAPDGLELAQDLLQFWSDPDAFGDEASVTRLAGKLGPIIDKARKLTAKAEGRNQ